MFCYNPFSCHILSFLRYYTVFLQFNSMYISNICYIIKRKKGRGILMIFKRMNEIEGDFILKVKVSHDFKETYDSASVMVMADVSH